MDGKAIAESVATNDELKYLRKYPSGPVYAPVTGFYSLIYGKSELEKAEDSVLSGTDPRLFGSRIADILTGREPKGGSVDLTLNTAAQQAALQGARQPPRGGRGARSDDRRDPGRGQHAVLRPEHAQLAQHRGDPAVLADPDSATRISRC